MVRGTNIEQLLQLQYANCDVPCTHTTQSKMYGAMFNAVKQEALEETQWTCKLLKLYLVTVVIFAIS